MTRLAAAIALAVLCAGLSPPAKTQQLTAVPFKDTGIYELGEAAGWTVSAAPGGESGKATYTIKRNNLDVIGSGELDLAAPAKISATLNEPAMLYVEVQPSNPAAKKLVLGAAVAPRLLRPSVPTPRDFDHFWASKIRALKRVPANPQLTPEPSDHPDVEYFTLKMDHLDGRHVYGQLARPRRAGKFPALALFQWASAPYPLQQQWVTERAAQGWLVINIQPHDVLPNAPQSYYDALPQELKEYSKIGREDRDSNYFLQMYLADYRAVDYLASRPDWNGRTLVVTGTSMGGQQSLCTAAFHPQVTGLVVHVPAGADAHGPLHGRASGYPFWPADNPKALATAQYFDTVNCAARVKVPSLVSMGFIDTVTPPVGIWIAFNQLRGPKLAAPMVDAPHNHQATEEQQLPYTERAAQWMQAFLAGRKPPLQ